MLKLVKVIFDVIGLRVEWECVREGGDRGKTNYYTPNKHTNQLSSLGMTVDGNSFNSSSFFKLFYFYFIFSSLFSPSLQIIHQQYSTSSWINTCIRFRRWNCYNDMFDDDITLWYTFCLFIFFSLVSFGCFCCCCFRRWMSCVIIRDLTNWRLNSMLLLLLFLQRWFNI